MFLLLIACVNIDSCSYYGNSSIQSCGNAHSNSTRRLFWTSFSVSDSKNLLRFAVATAIFTPLQSQMML